jgi:photosystem II stability/assembly factor-like uncharacterized protein
LLFVSILFLAFDSSSASAARKVSQGRRASSSAQKRRGAPTKLRQKTTARGAQPPQHVEPRQEEEAGASGGGEDVEGRQKWFYYKRAYPFGEIPAGARRLAWESRPIGDKGGLRARDVQPMWIPIGPQSTSSVYLENWGLLSGRINSVAVSPANPQLILVGASTGGIWRSTDGGASFAPVSDAQVDLAVGSIAFAPSNPSIVYAGMGDIDNAYLGTGVLRSTDAGATWTRVSNSTLPAPGTVAEIKVDPTNPNRVYLAQYTGNYNNALYTTNIANSSGFFISTDGGVSWHRTLGGLVRDLVIHPTNAQTLYLGTRRVDPTNSEHPPGVYKSTDGGENWAKIYTTPFISADLPSARDVRLAVTPAAPQRLYVYIGNASAGTNTVRVKVSDDGGQTWTNRNAVGIDPGQFGYNTYIHADPSNPDILYIGARDVYKSTDGGSNWTNMTKNFVPLNGGFAYRPVNDPQNPGGSKAHPDQQSFAFAPGNSNLIYLGNDGGLYKSADAGATFQSLNSTLSLTQFIGITQHTTDPNISYGGTQDNGTQRRGAGTSQWAEFAGGDGGRVVVNPLDPQMVFTTYVYGSISRYTNNGDTFQKTIGSNSIFGETSTATQSPRIAFYPPFNGNGVDQKLYFGTWRLFVSTDLGNTWTPPAGVADLTKGPANTNVTPSIPADVLTAIGVARSNTNVIYTGSARGRAMVSSDGGASWTDITAGLPDRFIESITVDPASPSTAYLTVSGYGSGHVFKTTNLGASWTDISNNLPNIPTSAFLIDPLNASTFYAGTDIGVFRSTNGGASWETFNQGMPPAVVTGFSARPDGRIQLSTYGRGAYELNRDFVCNFALAPASQSFVYNGGIGSLNLTATQGCNWTAASSVDWITILSAPSGSGNATLYFNVAANGTNAARTGTLTVAGQTFNVTQGTQASAPSVQFSSATYSVGEGGGSVQLTLTRTGDASSAFSVSYETVNQSASDRSDYLAAIGTVGFNAGETIKTLNLFITDDLFKETPETFALTLSNPQGAILGSISGAVVNIADNDAADGASPVRWDSNFDSTFFVQQHYRDFFNREPDAGGLAFWKNQIDECTTQECREIRRINVSAAFFVSIEFQETGYLVYRFYQSAHNTAERLPLRSFLADTQEIGRGVVIGQPGATALLEANKQAYADRFVLRPAFLAQYPFSMSAAAYVDALDANTGNSLTPAERQELVARLGAGQITRAQALRQVAENPAFTRAHYSRAFVLMQYFGYLRRNPNDPPQPGLDYSGYNFWLGKLNSFGGNPITSEMVKAFITSGEYQERFGR